MKIGERETTNVAQSLTEANLFEIAGCYNYKVHPSLIVLRKPKQNKKTKTRNQNAITKNIYKNKNKKTKYNQAQSSKYSQAKHANRSREKKKEKHNGY